jgi:hypothetical protein
MLAGVGSGTRRRSSVKTLEKRTELNPLEEMIIAHTLESAAGQDELMVKINQLTQERTQLQAVLAQHPWSNQGTAKRIREITGELDTLWSELRRARAARRVRLEEALGVHPEEEPTRPSRGEQEEAA